jgi:hypothetical protein
MRELRTIIFELRGMFTTGHLFRLLPLSLLAPSLSLWPYIGSPFVPAVLATFLSLEPFYNNMLNIWGGQMTAGALFPAGWTSTLRRRNIAVIIVTWGVLAFYSVLVAYVQPEPVSRERIAALVLYMASIQFPMLMIGNSFSWQQIRGRSGWGLEDAAAALTMLIGVGITSLPFFALTGIPGDSIILILYTAATGVFWWSHSIPRTARTIHEQYPDLWQHTRATSF